MKKKDLVYVIIIAIIIFIGVMFYLSYCSPCGEQKSKEDVCQLLKENHELRQANDSLVLSLNDCQKGKIAKKKAPKKVIKKITKEEVPEATITLTIPDDFIEDAPPVQVLEVKKLSIPQMGLVINSKAKPADKKKPVASAGKENKGHQSPSGNDKVTIYGYKDRPNSWFRYGAN